MRPLRIRARSVALATSFALAVALGSPAARADSATAQQLFNDGKALLAAGRVPEACSKLEESLRADPGMGTKFQLAECSARLGKTATAWALFLEVAAEARAQGQEPRARLAKSRAAALEPKLVKLEISVAGGGSPPPGLEVRRDGVPVGRAQWGTEVPVDPGQHIVTAAAPGKKRWEGAVAVGADVKVVHVVVPTLADADPPPKVVAAATPLPVAAPPPAASPAPEPAVAAQPIVYTPPGAEGRRGTGQRALALVSAGIGVAGIATGAVFGFKSKDERDQSAAHCAGNVCDATGVSLRDDAIGSGTVSTVAFGAGAALLVTGAVLWFTAPSSNASAAHVRIAPRVGGGTTGMAVAGEF